MVDLLGEIKLGMLHGCVCCLVCLASILWFTLNAPALINKAPRHVSEFVESRLSCMEKCREIMRVEVATTTAFAPSTASTPFAGAIRAQ